MGTHSPILTITGSDSTGGSGVQADIKTISALGGYAVSAITSITVQNTLGIQEFFDLPAEIVSGQIEAIINDIQPQIVKIGMIRSVSVLSVVVDALVRYKPRFVVYDPVVYSKRGDALMSDDVLCQVRHRLLPLCSLVIVNGNDAGSLLGGSEHLNIYQLTGMDVHGMANGFSSAVAVYLSNGEPMDRAIAMARNYVGQQVNRTVDLRGRSSELYNEFLVAIEHHCRKNRDVHFYADCLNVSSRYLAQVTRRICGKAPKNIIDESMIKEIEVSLDTTDRTVQEVAYDFGFSSQAHFAKFFKKMKGLTPSEFRKRKP